MMEIPTPLELQGCLPRLAGSGYVSGVPAINANRLVARGATLNDWYRDIVPTYSQNYDSCVGHGWANWMECVLRRHVRRNAIPSNRQINGDRIWMHARKRWWNGVMKGGIYIPQGFEAMKELGWLPDDSALVEVPVDFEAYNLALAETPLVQGHMVTSGWFDANHENGCLAHVYNRSMTTGGHCTLGIACALRDRTGYRALLNSWGDAWGWNGVGLMTDEFWLATALDDVCYTAHIPGGWCRLEECHGWKDALISTPRGNS